MPDIISQVPVRIPWRFSRHSILSRRLFHHDGIYLLRSTRWRVGFLFRLNNKGSLCIWKRFLVRQCNLGIIISWVRLPACTYRVVAAWLCTSQLPEKLLGTHPGFYRPAFFIYNTDDYRVDDDYNDYDNDDDSMNTTMAMITTMTQTSMVCILLPR
ncbi:predicted protein [Lichtheimia corymbifera JMRC:FSU:9682]|uniref:Uncharacterized protein n=1 Tax=Lichtheimia corymbifera JMRC:FSU:9682 TaxID=1263082 RepID=A0A068S0T1_9FUNG|nr:predicted protein [Lichtheimia corymbifera JMRC:FSU:9682]